MWILWYALPPCAKLIQPPIWDAIPPSDIRIEDETPAPPPFSFWWRPPESGATWPPEYSAGICSIHLMLDLPARYIMELAFSKHVDNQLDSPSSGSTSIFYLCHCNQHCTVWGMPRFKYPGWPAVLLLLFHNSTKVKETQKLWGYASIVTLDPKNVDIWAQGQNLPRNHKDTDYKIHC